MLRSGLLSMVALVALGVSRLAHGSMISHATDRDTFGRVGALIGLAMLAGLFLPAGVSSAAAKFIAFHRGADQPSGAWAVYGFLSWLGMAAATVLGALSALLAWLVLDAGLGEAISTGALAAIFSLYSVDKAALYGFGRVRAYMRLELIGSSATVLLTAVVVLSGALGGVLGGVPTYLTPLVMGYAVVVIGASVVLRGRHPQDHSLVDRSEVVGYTALASVGALCAAGFLQGLPVLAAQLVPPAEVAYFTAAIALVTPLYFLPRTVGIALFPAMAEAHGSGEESVVRRHADLLTRGLLALLAPLFVAGVFLARPALVAFGGAGYAGGIGVLQPILAATYLAVVQVAAVNALSSGARHRARIPVVSAVAGCLVGVGLALVFGQLAGAPGVAWAYVVGITISAAGPIVEVWRLYRMPWHGPMLRAVLVVGGGTVAAMLIGNHGLVLDLLSALIAATVTTAVLAGDLRGILAEIRARRHTTA